MCQQLESPETRQHHPILDSKMATFADPPDIQCIYSISFGRSERQFQKERGRESERIEKWSEMERDRVRKIQQRERKKNNREGRKSYHNDCQDNDLRGGRKEAK